MQCASASGTLDREFLGVRCRLIELAAAWDRFARAGDVSPNDPRLAQIRRSLEILLDGGPLCAERVQMAFSLPYEPAK